MHFPLHFTKGYIAHPYWPERERAINITKESGMSRARSEENRSKALTAHLQRIGMTLADFQELQARADRQFYTAADVERSSFGEFPAGEHDPAEITIPPDQLYGCLVQAADRARSSTRVVGPDQIRSTFQLHPLYTGKLAADGTWERFAVVTLGTGQKVSNQRALRRNDYIRDFTGTLTIDFDPSLADPGRVREFLIWAGREIGVGASRKHGWGRFVVRPVEAP